MRFQTLNDALAAGHPDCVALWPLGSNVAYGETVRHLIETGDGYRLISVYRDERGFYEEAITYLTA